MWTAKKEMVLAGQDGIRRTLFLFRSDASHQTVDQIPKAVTKFTIEFLVKILNVFSKWPITTQVKSVEVLFRLQVEEIKLLVCFFPKSGLVSICTELLSVNWCFWCQLNT